MAQQQQENRGSESVSTGGAYSCKVRRPWGSSTEAAVGQKQQSDEPLMSSPAVLRDLRGVGGHGGAEAASCKLGAAQRGGSQSPMGKPPLPTTHRLIAKGATGKQQSQMPDLPVLDLSASHLSKKLLQMGFAQAICSLQDAYCPGWSTKCTDQM